MGHRYIGSKQKVQDIVLNKIEQIVPENSTVCDLMCGTSVISLGLRKRNFNVIANDLMTYCYHHANVNLKFEKKPKFLGAEDFINLNYKENETTLSKVENYEKLLKALESSTSIKGYFWNEFSSAGTPKNATKPRNYFSPENASKIDGIRFNIDKLYKSKMLTPIEHSLIIHDLIMSINDISNIAGTYGHYMSKLIGRAKLPLKMLPTDIYLKKDANNHEVLKGYAEEVSKNIKCDLCYIDPPYMKRQYAANYHILETIARNDEPEAIGESGLRPWRDQYSNFCTKTKIRGSFKQIFRNMNCSNFLISYSEDGLINIEDFQELLTPFGDVHITEFEHKRFKSNDSKLKNKITEYMIYLKI